MRPCFCWKPPCFSFHPNVAGRRASSSIPGGFGVPLVAGYPAVTGAPDVAGGLVIVKVHPFAGFQAVAGIQVVNGAS